MSGPIKCRSASSTKAQNNIQIQPNARWSRTGLAHESLAIYSYKYNLQIVLDKIHTMATAFSQFSVTYIPV